MLKSSLDVLGYGVSFQQAEMAQAMGFETADMQTTLLPPRLRRRTSVATKMAFAAAERACKAAQVEPSELAVIFTSSLGEAAVTDQLCRDIASQKFPLSPTKFHNSVHNTASGYWSIAVGSKHPAMAMGGYQDSFALGLLEAWSQLHTVEKQVLLVCYEETPSELLLPDNQWLACASAFVLGHRQEKNGKHLQLGRPYCEPNKAVKPSCGGRSQSPALAAMLLLKTLEKQTLGKLKISPSHAQDWYVAVSNT